MEAILEVKNITKNYGQGANAVVAVDSVSLALNRGEVRRHGSQRACASNSPLNFFHNGSRLLCRKLPSHKPARRFANDTQFFVLLIIVHAHHHSIHPVSELLSLLLKPLPVTLDLLHAVEKARLGCCAKSKLAQQFPFLFHGRLAKVCNEIPSHKR